MDLKSYLSSRRTIPSTHLGAPGPDARQVAEILTLASRAPDHGKLVPWRFIKIEGADRQALGDFCVERQKQLAHQDERSLTDAEIDKTATTFTKAPVIVVLVSTAADHPKIPVWEQQLAAGAVGMNLLHASNAHGFSAQWLSAWMAYDSQVLSMLGLTQQERVVGFFHIGTPNEGPVERARPVIASITTTWFSS